MSTSENKKIVLNQWYEQLWNSWNVTAIDDLMTEDYVLHLSGVPTPLGREAAKGVVQLFNGSFPDLRHTVDEIVAEGDTVLARWSVRGTHTGDFQGIAATGNQISLSGTTVHHMRQNKIAETWLTFDNLELLQQLGAIPRAAQV